MNTKAVEFEITFAKISTDDSGFKSRREWEIAVQTARLSAVSVEAEMAWQSGCYDASETLTFQDGSRLMIANPRQSAFSGFARTLNSITGCSQ